MKINLAPISQTVRSKYSKHRIPRVDFIIFKVVGKTTDQTYIGGATSRKFFKLRQIFDNVTETYRNVILQLQKPSLLKIIEDGNYNITILLSMKKSHIDLMKLKVLEFRQSIVNVNCIKPKQYNNLSIYSFENLWNHKKYICCSEIYQLNEIKQRYRNLYQFYKQNKIPYLRYFPLTNKKDIKIINIETIKDITSVELIEKLNNYWKQLKSINNSNDLYCDDIIDEMKLMKQK